MNKKEALAEAHSKGYTKVVATGQSGDYAHGSRLYIINPSDTRVKLVGDGFPIGPHATISKVGREWLPSYFGDD